MGKTGAAEEATSSEWPSVTHDPMGNNGSAHPTPNVLFSTPEAVLEQNIENTTQTK